MGRGDRHQERRFTVPMPATRDWPFTPRPLPEYCGRCDEPAIFCACVGGPTVLASPRTAGSRPTDRRATTRKDTP